MVPAVVLGHCQLEILTIKEFKINNKPKFMQVEVGKLKQK
jgi:hypothetical protein